MLGQLLKRRKRQAVHPGLGLRAQVALVIAVLSFLPNLVIMLMLFLPIYGQLAETDKALWLPIGLWLLLVALLSTGIGYLLSRQLLLPLTRLSMHIDRLRRNMDRLARAQVAVATDDPREIVELKTSFNELFQQIKQEQSRRSSFSATLMHDLKTPLIAASHLLAVVRDSDDLSKEERIDIVNQLLYENQNLVELVQKMVDAYRFEREDVPLRRESREVSELMKTVIMRVQPIAEKQGVTIELSGQATAMVDAHELERALYNLLSNAVRYANKGIKVEIFPNLIRIVDDGPGLPDKLEHLAQPFNSQPIDIAGKRYNAGTGGLGLFISRRIIEAHGGRLVTESTGSKGTVLLVYLGQG